MAFRLTDEQWNIAAPIVAPEPRLETRGRPRRSDREVLEAVLRLIVEQGTWRSVSGGLAPHQTVFRRAREWQSRGLIILVIEALARDMEERGGVPLRECFLDNLFAEIAGKSPRTVYIQFTEETGDNPWPMNAKLFFEEPSIWRLLQACPSAWVRARLPNDLAERLKFF